MKLHFVLVKPSLPENIGACARAMNTMGFKQMRLVAPADHLHQRAKWLAVGSSTILDKAAIFPTLEQAVAGFDLVVATTARFRKDMPPFHPPSTLRNLLAEKNKILQTVALVFGPEDNGLSNRDLQLCDIVSTIPLAKHYPSLNLAQAVMLYAYELSALFEKKAFSVTNRPANKNASAVVRKRISVLFDNIGIPSSSSVYRRLMRRTLKMAQDDIRLAHFVCEKIESQIMSHNEKALPNHTNAPIAHL